MCGTVARANVDPDCWFGETDPSRRKKIQNRLAQRARRRRLAESRIVSLQQLERIDTTLAKSGFVPVIPQTRPQEGFVGELPPSVFEALFQNGIILGLSCAICVPSKSEPQQDSVPTSLQPTDLQMTTIHHRWIDRFPFPQMRDNMISLSEILDAEEFLKDLFSMQSFKIRSGYASWDPSAWTISIEFSNKWGYLFF